MVHIVNSIRVYHGVYIFTEVSGLRYNEDITEVDWLHKKANFQVFVEDLSLRDHKVQLNNRQLF